MFDPYSAEFRKDPYPFYRRLREQAPVHRNDDGFWLLSRYPECVAALQDWRWVHVENYGCLPETRASPNIPVDDAAAPPEPSEDDALPHGPADADLPSVRKLGSRALTPAVVRRLEPRIQAIVDELLDTGLEAGAMDVAEETRCRAGAWSAPPGPRRRRSPGPSRARGPA
jgi:cytochrome P450